LGGGYWLVGEVEAAWRTLLEGRPLHERASDGAGLLLNTVLQGHVLASQGRLHEAAERYQHIIESAAARRAFAIEASIRQASIFYEWNACEVAEAQLAGAIAQSPSPPFPGAGSGCPGPLMARPGTGGGRDTLA
jgi:hypothetical protein